MFKFYVSAHNVIYFFIFIESSLNFHNDLGVLLVVWLAT